MNPPEPCAVLGCSRLTQRSAGKGFSETYCGGHIEHLRRHGHPDRRSYRGWELRPYRKAAQKWLKQHRDHPAVRLAVTRLDALMWSQGRAQSADYQRSMVPKDKARNALARLRDAGKAGEQLLEIVIIINACHLELGPHGYPDWVSIQIGKLAKRLKGASGTIMRDHEGRRMTEAHPHASSSWKRTWEKWPRSEGRYIRILGEMILEKVTQELTDSAGEGIRQIMQGGNTP
ncbi:hypothetical protein GHK78_19425 [Sinorhizobium meliloti]|uniref:hypothetical protein n=1 Tax=Rhizobium meliloti TaxID=382 RepID=UPI00129659FD|nr:hypothetical protein [Sinorhizobium meliloti]MQX65147.1 hypothetical protein [Sinorhizobium meliloti]